MLLKDNGSEFSNTKCIENGLDGKGFHGVEAANINLTSWLVKK